MPVAAFASVYDGQSTQRKKIGKEVCWIRPLDTAIRVCATESRCSLSTAIVQARPLAYQIAAKAREWRPSARKPSTAKAEHNVTIDQAPPPFWRTKSLDELNEQEWEQLCDGCGRCCLLKLEEEDTGVLHFTRLACHMLDLGSCRCRDYDNRHIEVPDCLRIDPEAVRTLRWLPSTCGYRLVAEGKDLAWWHPLISGDPETVHAAGISVRGMARSEIGVHEHELER